MKYFLICLFALASLVAFGQDKSILRIELEGFQNKHGLQLIIADSSIEVKRSGTVLFEKEVSLTAPVMGWIDMPTGDYSAFWVEPGATRVIVKTLDYPESTEVPGSKSHEVFKRLKFATNADAYFNEFIKNPNHIAAYSYLSTSYKLWKFTSEQLSQMYDLVDEKNRPALSNLRAYLTTLHIPRVKAGAQLYDFVASDENGILYSTEDFRGKYLLLAFNYADCEPCLADLKRLAKDTRKQDNIQVLSYYENDDLSWWKNHVSKKKIKVH